MITPSEPLPLPIPLIEPELLPPPSLFPMQTSAQNGRARGDTEKRKNKYKDGMVYPLKQQSKGGEHLAFVAPKELELVVVPVVLEEPIVAVPSFMCADAFSKFLPFCTGFAAGCMIWMVVAEVLPDAFKEASASQVA
ncbi:hypothetical protein K1719_020954 [Acacia pycnantha]|nr:hypothetical protein K1719_020954 [Acacia pycnantha]